MIRAIHLRGQTSIRDLGKHQVEIIFQLEIIRD